MIEIERIDPAKLIFVPNGIFSPKAPSGVDVRAELGIEPEAQVIGTVCKLRPQKALGVLVEAAGRLVGRFPQLRVLIVGEGPERAALVRKISELGLGETVCLLGHRGDVPDVLESLDLAVCSSDFEGTPLSVLEYMEAGLAVVATRVGGVPDLITPDVHGLLVEPRDPVELASAVAGLLDDPARAAAMGRAGRARRRAEFDISVTVREVERIYTALAAGIPAAELTGERR
jgi:glycosyltransferase involved in cell wall biosynthesis